MTTKLFRRLVLPTSVDVNEVIDFDGLPVKRVKMIYTNKSSSSSSASKVTLNGIVNDEAILLGVVGNQYVNQIEIEFPKIDNELPSQFLLNVLHGSSSSEQDVTIYVEEYDASAKGTNDYFEKNMGEITPANLTSEE